MRKLPVHVVWFFAFMSFFSMPAWSEQVKNFGDYIIHYNALYTNFLGPKVARNYGITRSRNRIMLNITVQKKNGEAMAMPVNATVLAEATNLTGQLRTLKMRRVHDGNVIYHIGEMNVADGETLDFKVSVTPENAKEPYHFIFRQQFFTR